MDVQDSGLLKLWAALNSANVDYIMIGGFAVNFNGFARFTQDADILINDTLENRKKFRVALNECGLGDFALLETMDIIPGMTTISMDDGMYLDIFTSLPGFENTSFDKLMEESSIAEIDGISVRFLHINYLIKTKEITKRPKDLIDIEELNKIKNSISPESNL
jgi:hypothetical protein